MASGGRACRGRRVGVWSHIRPEVRPVITQKTLQLPADALYPCTPSPSPTGCPPVMPSGHASRRGICHALLAPTRPQLLLRLVRKISFISPSNFLSTFVVFHILYSLLSFHSFTCFPRPFFLPSFFSIFFLRPSFFYLLLLHSSLSVYFFFIQQ